MRGVRGVRGVREYERKRKVMRECEGVRGSGD